MNGMSSNRWDKVYNDFKGKRFSVWKEDITPFLEEEIDFLKNRGVKKILDAGCGDGRNLLAFAKAGFEMTGIDISQEACPRAKRVVKQYPQTKVICQDLTDLNGADEYDAIICDYVMVHLQDGKKVIENFHRALGRNAYLLIEFLSTDDPSFGKGEKVGENSFISHGIFHHFYSLDEVKNLLSLFKILEIRKIRHQDPNHVADYPRSKRHTHDSIYVLCNKP